MGTKLKNIALVGLGMIAGAIGMGTQLDAMAQKNTASPLPLEELRQLADVFGLIKSDYVEPVEDKKLLTEAISGMVSSLDPHSAYLDKKAFKELREGTQGKFVGLGIEVGMEDGYVKVISPIEDSPAYRAGIKAGDLITRLDATPVKGMTLDEAVKKMRGEPNTKITLTIARKDEDKPIVVTIVRQEIRVQSVKSKMIEPGYAWLRISQFQEPTVDDMAKKIAALYAEDPNTKRSGARSAQRSGRCVAGRHRRIGGIPADRCRRRLDQRPVARFEGNLLRHVVNSMQRAPSAIRCPSLPDAIKKVPMVVLVNSGSASASEIVAGALQDYKRATIMGTQTFGKGSVQTIRQLSADTAVKLTTARYYTPNGRSIQARGIVPDLLVDETAEGDGLNGLRLREADLQKHLTNDKDKGPEVHADVDPLEEEQRLIALEKKRKPLEFGSKEDFQLAQALNHLKGLPVALSKAPKVEMKKEPSINDPKNGEKEKGSDKDHNKSDGKGDKK